MGPVLLLHVGIVVLAIGARASESNRVLAMLEQFDQMPVEELRSIVTVKPKQREGQGTLNVPDLPQDPRLPFAPESPLFGPTGGNIDRIEGVDELSGHRIAAVGNRVGFQEAGPGLVPLAALDGDLVLEDKPRLGCGQTSAAVQPHRLQDSINGSRGDLPQPLHGTSRQGAELDLIGRDPHRQNGLQALGAGEVGCLPDGLKGF